MKIRELDSNNKTDLEIMMVLEISSLGLSGNDPTEFKEVIQYIARYGKIFLGYEIAQPGEKIYDDLISIVGVNIANGGERIPVAFTELITLDEGLDFYNSVKEVKSLKESPFIISMQEEDRIFHVARKFGFKDSDITIHHGSGTHAEYQSSGRGKQLLKYAMEDSLISRKLVQGYIDIAKKDSKGGLEDIFNDRSFALHLNQGYILADILQPPVYDSSIIYASVLKIPNIKLKKEETILNIKDLREKPENLVRELENLIFQGYVGTRYDGKRNKMTFRKLK